MNIWTRALRALVTPRPVFRQLTVIVLFFEVGIVLMVMPWMPLWVDNYFLASQPWLMAIASNPFLRGAVSGLGVVNVWAGVAELWRLYRALGAGSVPPAFETPGAPPSPTDRDDPVHAPHRLSDQ